ncbi:MAG: alpha/beta fold hydrolase [Candidatus Limnocylindrales bacterium]
MSTVTVDGVDWAMVERGTGHPLLLVHGFTGAAIAWAEHLDAFSATSRVIAPDLPGHGGTPVEPPERMTVERTADDLARLLATLGALPACVVGYSLGARIALSLAIAHPGVVDRLLLESPSAGLGTAAEREDRRTEDEALATAIERNGIDAFVDEWERLPVFASHDAMPPERAARVRVMRRANSAAGLAASLRAAGQGSMEPLFDRLADVRAPTLVITGAFDERGRPRAERVSRGIPGARLAVVDDAGHTPHDEQPSAFRRLALDFLQEDRPA